MPFLAMEQNKFGIRKLDFSTFRLELENHSSKNVFEKPADVHCRLPRAAGKVLTVSDPPTHLLSVHSDLDVNKKQRLILGEPEARHGAMR